MLNDKAASLVSTLLNHGCVPDYLRASAQEIVAEFDAKLRDEYNERVRGMLRAAMQSACERMNESAAAATEVGAS